MGGFWRISYLAVIEDFFQHPKNLECVRRVGTHAYALVQKESLYGTSCSNKYAEGKCLAAQKTT